MWLSRTSWWIHELRERVRTSWWVQKLQEQVMAEQTKEWCEWVNKKVFQKNKHGEDWEANNQLNKRWQMLKQFRNDWNERRHLLRSSKRFSNTVAERSELEHAHEFYSSIRTLRSLESIQASINGGVQQVARKWSCWKVESSSSECTWVNLGSGLGSQREMVKALYMSLAMVCKNVALDVVKTLTHKRVRQSISFRSRRVK